MILWAIRKLVLRKARREQPSARWFAVDVDGDAYSYAQVQMPHCDNRQGVFVPTDYYWSVGNYPELAGEVHAL